MFSYAQPLSLPEISIPDSKTVLDMKAGIHFPLSVSVSDADTGTPLPLRAQKGMPASGIENDSVLCYGAAPGAGFGSAAFNQFLEPLQIAFCFEFYRA